MKASDLRDYRQPAGQRVGSPESPASHAPNGAASRGRAAPGGYPSPKNPESAASGQPGGLAGLCGKANGGEGLGADDWGRYPRPVARPYEPRIGRVDYRQNGRESSSPLYRSLL